MYPNSFGPYRTTSSSSHILRLELSRDRYGQDELRRPRGPKKTSRSGSNPPCQKNTLCISSLGDISTCTEIGHDIDCFHDDYDPHSFNETTRSALERIDDRDLQTSAQRSEATQSVHSWITHCMVFTTRKFSGLTAGWDLVLLLLHGGFHASTTLQED
jgi:hypothetical protein